jgi:hypothetical protein
LKYNGQWISILKETQEEMNNPLLLKDIDWFKYLSRKHFRPHEDELVENFTYDTHDYTQKFRDKYLD